jgi:hypothetical protein
MSTAAAPSFKKKNKSFTNNFNSSIEKGISIENIKQQLSKYLTDCNEIYNNSSISEKKHYILNNNNKYLLYITKNNTTQPNTILLYFSHFSNFTNINSNVNSTPVDFFIELDQTNLLKNHIETVVEGFLYPKDTTDQPFDFLISDILVHNTRILSNVPYDMRFFTLFSFVFESNNEHCFVIEKFLNLDLSINLLLSQPLDNLTNLELFVSNNCNSNQLSHIEECLSIFNKKNKELSTKSVKEQKYFKIVKTNQTEIYKVFDNAYNTHQGLLYLPNKQTSEYLNSLFVNTDHIVHICCYNSKFKKWQIVFP